MDTDQPVYESPFSWRYASSEMRNIFSEEYKVSLWRRIWVAIARAQKEAGLVSQAELVDLVSHEHDINLRRMREIEKSTGHDVVAGIREFAEKAIVGGGKIHLGATSMDVVDNTDTLRVKEALRIIQGRLSDLLLVYADTIEKYAGTPCLGYTHLQPAEPTTVGYRLAFYAQELLTHVAFSEFVTETVRAKGMKGAVGTAASYAEILTDSKMRTKAFEKKVMDDLGLDADLITTQISTRIYDFYVLTLLSGIAASLYKFAADVRILQSPLFGEWAEPFGKKQVGSSAMPFKRNPVSSEKICSLARYVVHLPQVAAENAMHSYLERTLDDSANRRVIMAEGFLATDEMLLAADKILRGLVINQEAVTHNLETYGPFAGTERLIVAAVKNGADRQVVHEEIRVLSMRAWEEIKKRRPNPLASLLSTSGYIKRYVGVREIGRLLDVSVHVGNAPQRALALVKRIRQTAKKAGKGRG